MKYSLRRSVQKCQIFLHVYLTGSCHRFNQLQQLAIRLNISLHQPSRAMKTTETMWTGQHNPRRLGERLQMPDGVLSLLAREEEKKEKKKKHRQLLCITKARIFPSSSLTIQSVPYSVSLVTVSLYVSMFHPLTHHLSPLYIPGQQQHSTHTK